MQSNEKKMVLTSRSRNLKIARMSWLFNTMTNESGEDFMYYGTAKEIWNAAKETYSNVDNTSVIFEIKSLLHDLR